MVRGLVLGELATGCGCVSGRERRDVAKRCWWMVGVRFGEIGSGPCCFGGEGLWVGLVVLVR